MVLVKESMANVRYYVLGGGIMLGLTFNDLHFIRIRRGLKNTTQTIFLRIKMKLKRRSPLKKCSPA